MDYEKLYKEALEKARQELKTCGSMECDAARQIFRFFPELKESEDERIRKAVLGLTHLEGADNVLMKCSITKQDIINWLEKQKPAVWSEEDKNILESIINDFSRGYKSSIGQDTWLKSLHSKSSLKPVEQHSTENYEWSTDDSALINGIIILIEDGALDREEKDFYIERLKSLRPQSRWKPTEEQLSAFRYFVNVMLVDYTKLNNVLRDLLEDLEKL